MKKIVLILSVLVVAATGLFADGSAPRIISTIEIVQNEPVRTNENALRGYMDIEEGQVFTNLEEMNVYLDRELKDLVNTRYFANIAFDIAEGETGGDGNVPVVLTVTTTDAWTLLPIPYPLPDSQIGKNGWAFGLEINYNNFLGTMTDFYMDSNVKIAFGEPEGEQLRSWKIEPELRRVKTGNLFFDFKAKQFWEINQSLDPNTGIAVQKFSYYLTTFSVATEVEFGTNWTYGFEPGFEFKYGYNWTKYFNDDPLAEDSNGNLINKEDPFGFTLLHFIRQGRVDWEQTLRRGYELELSNDNRFGVSQPADTTDSEFLYIADLNLSASWYQPFNKIMYFYTRGQALVVFNEIRTGLGEELRGVKNDTMAGTVGFFWNNTLVIQPHRSNEKFNFQFHPFIDAGLAFDAGNPGDFADMLRVGAGTELVIMLGGIDLRARIGYDFLSGFVDFSFGTGLTY